MRVDQVGLFFFWRHLLALMTLLLPLASIGCGCGGDDDDLYTSPYDTAVLDPPTAVIEVGTSQVFAVYGVEADGTETDITEQCAFESSDPTVVFVSEEGQATGLKTGEVTVTATCEDLELTATATVTVVDTSVVSLQVTPASETIGYDTTLQYTATATLGDGTTEDVTESASWSSSDTDVATIDGVGLATAVAAGPATITATYAGKEATASLVVTGAALERITVSPSEATIAAGTEQEFTARARYEDGTTQDVTSQVSWSSSDEDVATVDDSGTATGEAEGEATITAELNDVSGDASLTVTAAEAVDLVGHDAVDIPCLHVVQEVRERGAIHGAAGVAGVIVSGGQASPSLVLLACDVRFRCLALRIEGVEVGVEALACRDACIDGASDG